MELFPHSSNLKNWKRLRKRRSTSDFERFERELRLFHTSHQTNQSCSSFHSYSKRIMQRPKRKHKAPRQFNGHDRTIQRTSSNFFCSSRQLFLNPTHLPRANIYQSRPSQSHIMQPQRKRRRLTQRNILRIYFLRGFDASELHACSTYPATSPKFFTIP